MFVASVDGLLSAGLAGTGGQAWDSPPGGNRSPLPLPETLPYQLAPLRPLAAYHWQCGENRACAERWWRVAAGILDDTGSSYTRPRSAGESVQFLVRQTVDVYHRDRAQFSAEYLSARPSPQRLSDIPARVEVVESPGDRTRWYHRQMSTLSFVGDVPAFATDSVACLCAVALPDTWCVVTYAREVREHDPIIFAQYGDWYIKVAEWD